MDYILLVFLLIFQVASLALLVFMSIALVRVSDELSAFFEIVARNKKAQNQEKLPNEQSGLKEVVTQQRYGKLS